MSGIPLGVGGPPPPGMDTKRGRLVCIKVRMLDDSVAVFHLGVSAYWLQWWSPTKNSYFHRHFRVASVEPSMPFARCLYRQRCPLRGLFFSRRKSSFRAPARSMGGRQQKLFIRDWSVVVPPRISIYYRNATRPGHPAAKISTSVRHVRFSPPDLPHQPVKKLISKRLKENYYEGIMVIFTFATRPRMQKIAVRLEVGSKLNGLRLVLTQAPLTESEP